MDDGSGVLAEATINWDDLRALPVEWRECLNPIEFEVPCCGGCHVVRWDPQRGATTERHDGADEVVVALSDTEPVCTLVVAAINSGKLKTSKMGDGGTRFNIMGAADAVGGFRAAQEVESALNGLDAPTGEAVAVRASKHAFVAALVEATLVRWVNDLGFAATSTPQVDVKVEAFDVDDDVLGVGAMFAVGNGMPVRAAVMVTDRWYDDVRQHGAVVAGRFMLGATDRGLVCAEFQSDPPAALPVLGWAKLFVGDPEPQDVTALTAVPHTAPTQNAEHLYVCSHTSWDYNDEVYIAQEGVHPAVVVDRVSDAVAWTKVADFREAFFQGDSVADYIEYFDFPDDFAPEKGDSWDLLALCVTQGRNPHTHIPSMATHTAVPYHRAH